MKILLKKLSTILIFKYFYIFLLKIFNKFITVFHNIFYILLKFKTIRRLVFFLLPENLIFKTEIENTSFFINSSDRVNSKKIFVNKKYPQFNYLKTSMEIAAINNESINNFYDLGAHYGNISIPADILYDFNKIIAIEPNPESFKILDLNIRLNNLDHKFELHNKLVGGENKTVNFYKFKNNTAASLISNDNELLKKYIKVNNLIIENSSFLGQLKFDEIVGKVSRDSLIWLFCQGTEIDIINSSQNIASKPYIAFHYSPLINKNNTNDIPMLINTLNDFGYKSLIDLNQNIENNLGINKDTFNMLNKKYSDHGNHTILLIF